MLLKINLYYSSNFKFSLHSKETSSTKSSNLKSSSLNNRITNKYFCYNILYSLLQLQSTKVIGSAQDTGYVPSVTGTSLFVKQSKRVKHTILRAPYRYKLGRYQVGKRSYLINLSLVISLPKSTMDIVSAANFIGIIVSAFSDSGTNVTTLSKVKARFAISNPQFFYLTSYSL